jgi:hypothetical protein
MTDGTFEYNGRVYPYITAEYQSTRKNERAVELPIALHYYNEAGAVMEVGAVLPHYIPGWPKRAHPCIDLHEQFPAVINADVLTYEPMHMIDLVICVSTLDHLNNADEVITAVERMKSWLVPGGLLFATIPANQPSKVGGGPWLDDVVLSGALDMTMYRMDKVDPAGHNWQQVDMSTPAKQYGHPTTWANTVYLFEWVNE